MTFAYVPRVAGARRIHFPKSCWRSARGDVCPVGSQE